MDIQKYIESGILEEYCMGLLGDEEQAFLIQMAMLYPEIKEALTEVELVLEKLAVSAAVEPGSGLRDRIIAELGLANDETTINIDQLPPIDRNADQKAWSEAVQSLIHGEPSADFVCRELRKDDRFQQMLIIAKTDVPEEEHGEYLESFLILKGECECTIGNDLVQLKQGDFIEIPLRTKHNVKVLSPVVIAILQYEFV